MAAADPADGNPGMSYRLFLVPGQQGRGGSGRARHAAKSGSCESCRPGGLTTPPSRSALSPPRRPGNGPAYQARPRVPAARCVPAGRGDLRDCPPEPVQARQELLGRFTSAVLPQWPEPACLDRRRSSAPPGAARHIDLHEGAEVHDAGCGTARVVQRDRVLDGRLVHCANGQGSVIECGQGVLQPILGLLPQSLG